MTTPALPPRPRLEKWQPVQVTRPRLAVYLWVLAAALQIGSSALALLDFDQLSSALTADIPEESSSTKDKVVLAALGLLLGSGVLVSLLQLVSARALYVGKRWARVVLVPLGLLGALHGTLVYSTLNSVHLSGLLAAAGLVAGAIVAMFLSAGRRS